MEKAKAKTVKTTPAPIDPVDQAGLESFPASDPPSFEPAHAGGPRKAPKGKGKA